MRQRKTGRYHMARKWTEKEAIKNDNAIRGLRLAILKKCAEDRMNWRLLTEIVACKSVA